MLCFARVESREVFSVFRMAALAARDLRSEGVVFSWKEEEGRVRRIPMQVGRESRGAREFIWEKEGRREGGKEGRRRG